MSSLSIAQQVVFEAYVSYCQRIPSGRVDLVKLKKFIHECESVCILLFPFPSFRDLGQSVASETCPGSGRGDIRPVSVEWLNEALL